MAYDWVTAIYPAAGSRRIDRALNFVAFAKGNQPRFYALATLEGKYVGCVNVEKRCVRFAT